MSTAIRLRAKYRDGRAYKNVGSQHHSGTVHKKRRTIDMRKLTGRGRDWYR